MSGRPLRTTLVIPCFDEAARLDDTAFLKLAGRDSLSLIFVDDGSADRTLTKLRALRARSPATVDVLALATNRGKGEAVRRGLLAALARGADLVGYLDADLSTPIEEMWRLIEFAQSSTYEVVIGSRIVMLGTNIQRNALRHSFGRLFATAAAIVLRQGVYDTQCGAKVFRRSELLETALATPFVSSWTFDVELIGRLLGGTPELTPLAGSRLIEVPLLAWHHTPGSKLHPFAMVRATAELALIVKSLQAFRTTSRRR